MLFDYDFNSLAVVSFALLSGGYLVERWIPGTLLTILPIFMLVSGARGAMKAGGSAINWLYPVTRRSRRHGQHKNNRASSHHSSNKRMKHSNFRRSEFHLFGLSAKHFSRQWMTHLYHRIPLNAMSRLWGKFHRIDLPVWMRSPVFQLYTWVYGCQVHEAVVEDLTHYKNLSEFFRRSIKSHLRPIHPSILTSPVDGQVLHCGRVEAGHLEQVKGISYTLQSFLGPVTWRQYYKDANQVEFAVNPCDLHGTIHNSAGVIDSENGVIIGTSIDDKDYQETIRIKPGHDLFHCVIYLAPGDYHRFHSPANWSVFMRRHFPGKLLSVNPRVARWIKGLFAINERAVYIGEWMHGFFSYTAVGATNVGSIRVFCDKNLQTNTRRPHSRPTSPADNKSLSQVPSSFHCPHGHKRQFYDACLIKENEELDENNLSFNRGDLFGEFNFGSTIVLIFEAPKDFKFNVEPKQKLKFGEALGDLANIEDSQNQ